nr:uncharacterized protein LOC110074535 isoform X1 [Pogona vitticeps]XP_020640485.1 uncharacterized protein LOC110074535 isoform X2 [Pogona vitticeps]
MGSSLGLFFLLASPPQSPIAAIFSYANATEIASFPLLWASCPEKAPWGSRPLALQKATKEKTRALHLQTSPLGVRWVAGGSTLPPPPKGLKPRHQDLVLLVLGAGDSSPGAALLPLLTKSERLPLANKTKFLKNARQAGQRSKRGPGAKAEALLQGCPQEAIPLPSGRCSPLPQEGVGGELGSGAPGQQQRLLEPSSLPLAGRGAGLPSPGLRIIPGSKQQGLSPPAAHPLIDPHSPFSKGTGSTCFVGWPGGAGSVALFATQFCGSLEQLQMGRGEPNPTTRFGPPRLILGMAVAERAGRSHARLDSPCWGLAPPPRAGVPLRSVWTWTPYPNQEGYAMRVEGEEGAA